MACPQLLKAKEAKRKLRYISFQIDFRVNYPQNEEILVERKQKRMLGSM
jgi:hypothetical protein